ncbi:MAG: hypothetical protein M5U26_23665 [Planctomycetota bacterium]|nr:hypothetical protein [Planctomycetota bacterium]
MMTMVAPESGDVAEDPAQGSQPRGVLNGLASLAPKTLVTEEALAAIFQVTPRTIRRMVARNELPPPVRLSGKPTWIAERIMSHLDARAERAAQEADREERRRRALLQGGSCPGRDS